MTKLEALGLLQGLDQAAKFINNGKFTYAAEKNFKLLSPINEEIQKAGQPIEGFKEFNKSAEQLIIKNCKKDKDGNPIKHPAKDKPGYEEYEFEDKEAHIAEYEKLKKTHKKDIDEQIEKDNILKKIYEEEVDLNIHKIKIEYALIDAISPMIED